MTESAPPKIFTVPAGSGTLESLTPMTLAGLCGDSAFAWQVVADEGNVACGDGQILLAQRQLAQTCLINKETHPPEALYLTKVSK